MGNFGFKRLSGIIATNLVMGSLCIQMAMAAVVVPPGNRNAKQPPIPGGSKSRTKATNGTFEGKYQKIHDMLASNKKLTGKIKKTARKYGIDPIHIVGALVGEHTYNVDAMDHLQTYYVKAMSYLKSDIDFEYEGEKVSKFVKRPQFAKCSQYKSSYDLWTCRENVWKAKFAGKTVDGVSYPRDRFSRVFFQPLYAGQTFGLGQLNPLTALMATDTVNRVGHLRKLNPDKAPKVYEAIMDPDTTLQYMAATLKISIDSYNQIAGFDISKNPGVTATLYNLGNVRNRAYQLKAKNKGNSKPVLPQENYYGWLVNNKESELRALLK